MFLRTMLFGASLLAGVSAQSAGNTTFAVSATVLQTCTVTAADLAFGPVNVLLNAPTDAATTITLFCGTGVNFRVGLDEGQGTGGSTTTRVMTNTGGGGGAGTLNYILTQDANHTLNWGNTDPTDTEAATGTGADQTLNVYGRILAGQQAATYGTYADTISVYVYY
jgi:spore coat protein U-like protein